MSYFRRSAITWTSTADSGRLRVHQLDAPLVERSPQMARNVYTAESLDFSNREVYAVDNGAWDLVASVRYDRHQQSLMDLIAEGAKGTTLTYYPDLADPAVNASVVLLSPLTPAQLQPDAAMQGAGHQSVRLVFRRTDEGRFHEHLTGTDVLFRYSAGEDLTRATFSRDTNSTAPATYVSLTSAGNGYGTISTAADEQARIEWVGTASSVGPRYIPTLLLERSRQNYLKDNTDLESTDWSAVGATQTMTSAQADPAGGTDGFLLRGTSSGGGRQSHTFTFTASTFVTISIYSKAGTTASTAGSLFELFSSLGLTPVCRGRVTYTSGVPTLAVVSGAAVSNPERVRGGWWRTAVRTTAAVSTGVYRMRLWANGTTGTGTTAGNVYWYGPQVEQ